MPSLSHCYFVPIKAGLPEKKTGAIVGLLRVSKSKASLAMTSHDSLMLRNLQNMMAALFLIYKERARYRLSEIVIQEFVNRSSLH